MARVATDGGALLIEQIVARAHLVDCAEGVPGVRVLGHDAQHARLVSTEHQWRSRPLERGRQEVSGVQLVVATGVREARAGVAEQAVDDRHRLVGAASWREGMTFVTSATNLRCRGPGAAPH